MNDFSVIDKVKILLSIISNSPFFLFCGMLSMCVLIYLIVCSKKDSKINKWIFSSIWAIVILVLLIKYNSILFNAFDSLFNSVFMGIYFPNLSVYATIIIVTNASLIYSFFNKKNKLKTVNFINSIIINLLLILVIDTIKTNNINIYEEMDMYMNKNLLVLLQLTSATFISWLLINILYFIKDKLKKYDKLELPKMQEIVFDEF